MDEIVKFPVEHGPQLKRLYGAKAVNRLITESQRSGRWYGLPKTLFDEIVGRVHQRRDALCVFLNPLTVLDEIKCNDCKGNTRIKVLGCDKHERCTIATRVDNTTACCGICDDYKPRQT